ncbi:putative enoylhydratase isomerase family protein [Diaporthe ampelina]|uniref:Putative enoylhydratase isomerase family protein n=1 Tax=Diaporthe ampelina TaxID=1214573 RepID=A0A0G2I3F5_9PEZI|nr:putative enoylhydratase isomerase family protein [Diaporthe ampelina]
MAPTPPPTALYEPSSEGITVITINRPESRNAVNAATARLLAEAFQKFDKDDTQKVCVFTGAGGEAFCAGYDLHEVAGSPSSSASNIGPDAFSRVKPVTTTDPRGPLDEVLGPMGPSRMLTSKPVIAAISGHAVAGGLELALLADVRVCDTTAVLGVFCRRFGVPLIDGGTVRLPKIVGLGRALDMILTGRPVDAREALGMGLVNRAVDKGRAVEEAMALARSLLAFPQECMNLDRRSAYYSTFEAPSLKGALRFEHDAGVEVVAKESVQGASRFHKGQGRGGSFEPVKGKL